MAGLSKSNRASSAACFSALATLGVLPEPVSGRSTATFTAPLDPLRPGAIGPGPLPPPQAASRTAMARLPSRTFAARSVKPIPCGRRMTPSLQDLETREALASRLVPRAADANATLVRRRKPVRRAPIDKDFGRKYGSIVMGVASL